MKFSSALTLVLLGLVVFSASAQRGRGSVAPDDAANNTVEEFITPVAEVEGVIGSASLADNAAAAANSTAEQQAEAAQEAAQNPDQTPADQSVDQTNVPAVVEVVANGTTGVIVAGDGTILNTNVSSAQYFLMNDGTVRDRNGNAVADATVTDDGRVAVGGLEVDSQTEDELRALQPTAPTVEEVAQEVSDNTTAPVDNSTEVAPADNSTEAAPADNSTEAAPADQTPLIVLTNGTVVDSTGNVVENATMDNGTLTVNGQEVAFVTQADLEAAAAAQANNDTASANTTDQAAPADNAASNETAPAADNTADQAAPADNAAANNTAADTNARRNLRGF